MKDYIESVRESFSGSIQELRTFDWGDLSDTDTMGLWPRAVKFLIGLILFAICIGLGLWFHVKNQQAQLVQVTARETALKQDFEAKAHEAINLDLYKAQMVEMQEKFGELLSQLPAQTEVPGLLDDISFTGTGSGLEFSTIQLGAEVAQEFYVELPININVTGSYHDFGTFVSGVASLDRIVTLHDFTIARASRGALNMQIQAKTYKYNNPQ